MALLAVAATAYALSWVYSAAAIYGGQWLLFGRVG